jgi:hypothetical protein
MNVFHLLPNLWIAINPNNLLSIGYPVGFHVKNAQHQEMIGSPLLRRRDVLHQNVQVYHLEIL